RIWQRSATVWSGVPVVSVTRSLKSSSGAAAKRCGSAASTWKLRSGMGAVSIRAMRKGGRDLGFESSRLRLRSFLQGGEEPRDVLPHVEQLAVAQVCVDAARQAGVK